jgi:hypothetical protein
MMFRTWSTWLVAVAVAAAAFAEQPTAMRIKAPEIDKAGAWINSKPLSLADLRGKVVVLHFWTFG